MSDQSRMAEDQHNWFNTRGSSGLVEFPGLLPGNSGFWPPQPLHEGSSGDRSQNHNYTYPRDDSEFRQWPEQRYVVNPYGITRQ